MDVKTSRYPEIYARWQRDPTGFWGEAADAIDWIEKPKTVFDPNAGVYGRWFPDGVCNTCYNAVDRHVIAGRGTQPAIIYDSPVTGIKQTITYAALQTKTETLAGILKHHFGVQKGDRVILYMPMVPEALVAMLACARLGAVHSVVFGGFAPKELATRIDDAKPKVILSASCGIEAARVIAYKPLLDAAIDLAKHKPDACMILQRPQLTCELTPGRDHDWQETWDKALVWAWNVLEPVPVRATDPLYILYTSGTTGIPKGVVRDNGGHMVALQWSMQNLYGVNPGETWWCGSDIGWVVGHSYIVYAAAARRDLDPLRGQAGRHARRRRLLARHLRARRGGVLRRRRRFAPSRKKTPRASISRNTTCRNSALWFLAGDQRPPDTIRWAKAAVAAAGNLTTGART